MKRFFVLFLIFVLNLSSCTTTQKPILSSQVSQEEKVFLSHFFSWLFKNTSAGYVLYGDKPMYIDTLHFYKKDDEIISNINSKEQEEVWQGLSLLEKIPLAEKKYLIAIKSDSLNKCTKEINIINKTALSLAIRENIDLFEKVWPNTTEAELMELIQKHPFSKLFRGHIALQGIVLGYGRKNSLAFERIKELMKVIPSQESMPPLSIQELKEVATQYAKSHSTEWKDCIQYLENFTSFENNQNSSVKIPFSYLKNSPESETLISSYKLSEAKLVQLLDTPNFMDQVLELLKH